MKNRDSLFLLGAANIVIAMFAFSEDASFLGWFCGIVGIAIIIKAIRKS